MKERRNDKQREKKQDGMQIKPPRNVCNMFVRLNFVYIEQQKDRKTERKKERKTERQKERQKERKKERKYN